LARRGNGVLKANASEGGAQMVAKGGKINIINYKIINILASIVLILLTGTRRLIKIFIFKVHKSSSRQPF
jgi:hypothetical protein